MTTTASERLLRAGFIAALVCVAAYLVISAFEPMRLNWGDPWSDTNALTSGKHFDEEGFVKLAFTPRVDISPVGPDTLVYIHYPPLPDLLDGLLQRITGGYHLALFRIVALVFSGLSLVFFHAFLRRLWGGGVAKLATVAMATNLLFLQYADTLHHIPLYTSMGFAALAAGARWLDERRPWQLAAVAVATFLCFFASYDYYFFTPIMLLAAIRFRGHRWLAGPGLRLILVFALAGLASIVVKNLLAIWAVGVDTWHKDLVFQFLERSTSTYARTYKEGFSQVIFWRLYRFFSPLFYVYATIYLVGVIDWVRGRPTDLSLQPLSLLVAGVPFVLVFSQLIVEQYHPTLLFLPFAAAGLAALVALCWRRSRLLAVLLFAAYLGWQGYQLRLFRKQFLRPDDIAGISKVLQADRHNFLMTNLLVDAPCRYYWNRYAIGIIDDPMILRNELEVFGSDSPLTIVQLKHSAPYAYDKGIYMNFGGDRRWPWVSRPDYYRNSWARPFDDNDQRTTKRLAEIGRVVYESSELRVRQVSLADLDRLQRDRLPADPPGAIDFEAAQSELYKLDGFTERQPSNAGIVDRPPGESDMPGFAWLIARLPQRTIFTLKGFNYLPTGPAIKTSDLMVPMAGPSRVTLAMSTPFSSGQEITVWVNHHELLRQPLTAAQGVSEFAFDVTDGALISNGPQLVTIGYAQELKPSKELPRTWRAHAAVRLHRMTIKPLASAPSSGSPAQ